jgi:hypothetical protein
VRPRPLLRVPLSRGRPDRSQFQTLTPINYRLSGQENRPARLKTLSHDHVKRVRLSMDKTFRYSTTKPEQPPSKQTQVKLGRYEGQIRQLLENSGWMMIQRLR